MTKKKYLGQIIDENGRKLYPTSSSAIKNMPSPTNVSSLQGFLGFANYYKVFIQNVHFLRVPLNNLLKKRLQMELDDRISKSNRNN